MRWVKPTTSNGMPLYGVRVHIASHDHPNTMCQFFGMLVQAWKLLLPSQNWSENRTREAHMFLFCTYALKREKYCPHSLEQQRVIYTHYYYFCNFAWLRVSTFPKSPGARPKLPEAKISEQATSWTYSWTDTVAMALKLRLLVIRQINTAMGVVENGPKVPKPWVSILK